MIEGSRSGSIPLTNGSGSDPKNMWIRIRIRSPKTCGSGGSGFGTLLIIEGMSFLTNLISRPGTGDDRISTVSSSPSLNCNKKWWKDFTWQNIIARSPCYVFQMTYNLQMTTWSANLKWTGTGSDTHPFRCFFFFHVVSMKMNNFVNLL
jgi:hypothetical protein